MLADRIGYITFVHCCAIWEACSGKDNSPNARPSWFRRVIAKRISFLPSCDSSLDSAHGADEMFSIFVLSIVFPSSTVR